MRTFGQAFSLWSLVKEVNLDEVRQNAEKIPLIIIAAKSNEKAETVMATLSGGYQRSVTQPGPFRTISFPLQQSHIQSIARADAILYIGESGIEVTQAEIEEIHQHVAGPKPIISILPAKEWGEGMDVLPSCVFARTVFVNAIEPAELLQNVVPVLIDSLQEEGLHLARRMPPLRDAMASLIVSKTSRVNAEFAFLTNVPAVIPIVGNIIGATADFIILTKNQVMMLYRLAAVYGRDIHSARKVYSEVLPVVGAGLVWRTVAREIAVLVPVWAGAIPKVVIAYAGTFTVGRAACYYYGEGYRPSGEKMKELYKMGVDRARALRLTGGKNPQREEDAELESGS